MFKWILAAVALVLLAAFVRWQRAAVKTSFVNGLAPYGALPGKEYIFERDCYIFKFRKTAWWKPSVDTDQPLVGDHDVVPVLPANVSAANIGADIPGVRILDIVRVGDRARIASVRRDESRTGTTITFELFFVNDEQRKYPRIDAFWIMDHTPEQRGEAPLLRPEYAVERARD